MLHASGSEDAAFEELLALSRTLLADLPPELAQVARVCLADLDRQFEFGLEALLASRPDPLLGLRFPGADLASAAELS